MHEKIQEKIESNTLTITNTIEVNTIDEIITKEMLLAEKYTFSSK